jgi:proteasome lid subunit RPN8/RPN11
MSTIEIPLTILERIHAHGEAAYPEEGAGFLLGLTGEPKRVVEVLPLPNLREAEARRNRYLIAAQDYLQAELTAERLGLSLIGVFHSHPDHPNRPSEFDREWAQPFFSYLITSVEQGHATASRCWQLSEDRSHFIEETLLTPQSLSADVQKS